MAAIDKVYPLTPHRLIHEAIARVAEVFEFETDLDSRTGDIFLDTRPGTQEKTYLVKIKDIWGHTKLEMEGDDKFVLDSFMSSVDADLTAGSQPQAFAETSIARPKNRPRNPLGTQVSAHEARLQSPAASAQAETKPKKNWLLRILGACALAWLFWTDEGKELTNSVLSNFGDFVAEADIGKYDCGMVSDEIKGMELKNMLGGRFKIVSVETGSEMERTSTSLTCSAEVLLDDGSNLDVAASVRKNGKYEVLLGVKPLGM